MESPARRAYRFAGFRVDLAHHQLTGPDGAPLPLSGRAYDVLVYLLDNRDRVVSKDELMKAVWPRVVVEENNLNQAVTVLRRALGDRRDAPQFLRTIAGRGYRFVADVTEETHEVRVTAEPAQQHEPKAVEQVAVGLAEEADGFARRRAILLGLGAVAVAAGGAAWFLRARRDASTAEMPRTIAVLPFKPLVDGDGDPALEFGMADTLITRLSGLPGLIVRPLSSVRRYGKPDQDPVAAGRDLAVEAVLEGHVHFRADRIRLTTRLLDVASGAAIWAGEFDERIDDLLSAQDALADRVVTALEIEITGPIRQQLLQHPTDDVQAWQLYLNGRYHWERKNPESMKRAVEYFDAAEKRDPTFALAAVGQADAWAVLGVWSVVPADVAFGNARAASARALSIDPTLPEALASMGHVLVQWRHDWRGGEGLYRRALAAKPTYGQARMWLANDLAYQGHLRESLAEARRTTELEPLSLTFAANVGLILYCLRDFAAARARLEPIVEANPDFGLARVHLARVYVASGAAVQALAMLTGHRATGPGALSTPARAYAASGRQDLARAEIARLDDMGRQGLGVGFDLALVHSALGEKDRALDAIERAAIDGSQMLGFLNSEPGFDGIRGDPRFRAISKRIGLG